MVMRRWIDILAETREDPAHYYVAAVNHALKRMGNRVVVSMEVEGANHVHIHSIDAVTEEAGYGERALKKITKLADKNNVTLSLDVSADPGDEFLASDSGRLVSWYRWHGFRVTGRDDDPMQSMVSMEREPRAAADDAALRDTLITLAVRRHGDEVRPAVIAKVKSLSSKDLRAYLRNYRHLVNTTVTENLHSNVFEVFDAPDVRWTEKSDRLYVAEIPVTETEFYRFEFKKRAMQSWSYDFARHRQTDMGRWDVEHKITPALKPFQIIGTAHAALMEFLDDVQPNIVGFTASAREPSRVKLYDALMRRFDHPNYRVEFEDHDRDRAYFIKRA